MVKGRNGGVEWKAEVEDQSWGTRGKRQERGGGCSPLPEHRALSLANSSMTWPRRPIKRQRPQST
eukprot:994867-Rhodomonas_salina.1